MNNKQLAQQAWAEYCKGFAIKPNEIENINLIAYAFKHAFVLGMNAAEQELQQMELPLEKKVIKTGIKRTYGGRLTRTYEQRKRAAYQLINILQALGETKLRDIIFHMNQSGFNDWNDNNASGFVKDAMQHYPRIKRIGYGLYKYEG